MWFIIYKSELSVKMKVYENMKDMTLLLLHYILHSKYLDLVNNIKN